MSLEFLLSRPSEGEEHPCAFCKQSAKIGRSDTTVEKYEEDDPTGLFTVSYGVWHRNCLEQYLESKEY
jgi:hypothetical protein